MEDVQKKTETFYKKEKSKLNADQMQLNLEPKIDKLNLELEIEKDPLNVNMKNEQRVAIPNVVHIWSFAGP